MQKIMRIVKIITNDKDPFEDLEEALKVRANTGHQIRLGLKHIHARQIANPVPVQTRPNDEMWNEDR